MVPLLVAVMMVRSTSAVKGQIMVGEAVVSNAGLAVQEAVNRGSTEVRAGITGSSEGIGYQIAVNVETENYAAPVGYDPNEVRFRLTIVSYSDSTDVPACTDLFPGDISVTFNITMQNGTSVQLQSAYKYSGDRSWFMTWTPFVAMSDDLWVVSINNIVSVPDASFIATDNFHLMRRRSLLLAVDSDYYSRFQTDMPHLIDIVSEAYEHMTSLTQIRAPLCVFLSTLYRCTVAYPNVCYISIYGEFTNYSFFSYYMRDWYGGMPTIFHEMTHAFMNINDLVFCTLGSEGYREWFTEGEADYIGRFEMLQHFGSQAEEFVTPSMIQNYIAMLNDTFDVLLKNNGTITNTKWRTTPDAGEPLQNASHPEVEGASLLYYLETNYRPNFVDQFYAGVRQFWNSLPPSYHTWSDVWGSESDVCAQDTILVGLLSKAACADLAPLFTGNLSFKLYGMNDFKSHVSSDVFQSYTTTVGTKQTSLNLSLQTVGKNVTLKAKLTNSTNEPVVDQQIEFYVASSLIGSAQTDSSGEAVIAYDTRELETGNYTVMACYGGGSNYTANLGRTILSVGLKADLNGDGKVGLPDLVILAQAYGSKPGDSKWNPDADIDGNGIVGLSDLVVLAQRYGQHYP